MITIKGRVVDQTTKGADEHIDKLAKRYLNAERYPAHSSSVKRIILKIKPEKIFYVPPIPFNIIPLSHTSQQIICYIQSETFSVGLLYPKIVLVF
jgi:hypothetical protein